MAEVKTFEYPNCIVRVHIPELTEDERKQRIDDLKQATANFMKAVEKGRRKKQ